MSVGLELPAGSARAMGFLAVLVTAVLLISLSGLNPLAVGVAANVAAAYCAWRAAISGADRP
jgi:hypothetical protein